MATITLLSHTPHQLRSFSFSLFKHLKYLFNINNIHDKDGDKDKDHLFASNSKMSLTAMIELYFPFVLEFFSLLL